MNQEITTDQMQIDRYKQQAMEELNGALDLGKQDWQRVAVRLTRLDGSARFSALCEEMEERFLVRPHSGNNDEATLVISLHPSKRELLINTVISVGYKIKDAHRL